MGNYTILGGFENARRGRQATKFNNKCSKNSRSQIVFRTDIFRKLTFPRSLTVLFATAFLLFLNVNNRFRRRITSDDNESGYNRISYCQPSYKLRFLIQFFTVILYKMAWLERFHFLGKAIQSHKLH